MKFIVTGYDGCNFFDETVAGVIVVKDDALDTDEIITAISDEFMPDMNETWETLDEFLEERYGETVTYEGYEGIVYI